MTWVSELTKIRRYLRDPNGNIWSEALLKNLYNAVQREIQERIPLLEDIEAIRVPPGYQNAYLYDWEWRQFTTDQNYQALRYHHQANIVCCFQWEAQNTNQIDSGTPEEGSNFTQVWEAFMTTPGIEVKFRFPVNLGSIYFMAYDREPIYETTRKEVQSRDPSYIQRTGETQCYFHHDELDNSFIPYPRPSTSFTDDIDPDNPMALFQNGDTVDSETGDIIQRDGTFLDADTGIAVDIVEEDDNFFIVYRAIPTDIVDQFDESDFPQYLRKYIRYGVLHRAYKANTDGRIPTLEEYWGFRYELGLKFLEKFRIKRKEDRQYIRSTQRHLKRTKRHPRLPDSYPAI